MPAKRDFPVSHVRRYLEPGPIVLVSSRWQGQTNIMTLGWHTVLEFTPSLVDCMISAANHRFRMIRGSRECVINLPTTALTDTVAASATHDEARLSSGFVVWRECTREAGPAIRYFFRGSSAGST
jgi:flavin reductase (DIM6/NTAB) family NADH-FMN oxidoreductase RutF